jgi:hypothetical protein
METAISAKSRPHTERESRETRKSGGFLYVQIEWNKMRPKIMIRGPDLERDGGRHSPNRTGSALLFAMEEGRRPAEQSFLGL